MEDKSSSFVFSTENGVDLLKNTENGEGKLKLLYDVCAHMGPGEIDPYMISYLRFLSLVNVFSDV